MHTLTKTCQVLNGVGITLPEEPSQFFEAIRDTDWNKRRINWQDPATSHENAREALRILGWMIDIEAFNGTIDNDMAKSPAFRQENIEGIWNMMDRLLNEARQANSQQQNKDLLLVSYKPETGEVSESRHYGIITHQIQKFARMIQIVHPHDPISKEIREKTKELIHGMKIQMNQELTQLRERSREVSETTAFYGDDHTDLLDKIFSASDIPGGSGSESPSKEGDDAYDNFGKMKNEGKDTASEKRQRFSRERETLPNFTDLGELPSKENATDLSANKTFIRKKGEILLNILEEKNIGIPDRGTASATSRNDVGSTLVKIHRRIVNTSPDLKLQDLEPDNELYNAIIREQITYGVLLVCNEFKVDYEEFRKGWKSLQELEMAKDGGETMTYEDAVWTISNMMKKNGKLPEDFDCGRFSTTFTSKGGACVERSDAVNEKKKSTVKMLDEVTRYLHTNKNPKEVERISDLIVDLFKAENAPSGSGRSLRREIICELERVISNPELRNEKTPEIPVLKEALKTIRNLGKIQLHGEEKTNPLLNWDMMKDALRNSLRAVAELPAHSGSIEKETKYIQGSDMPLFAPGEALIKTLGFCKKNVPHFDTLGEDKIGNIHKQTHTVIEGLNNPGYYAAKAANLPTSDIQKSLDRTQAGIHLLDRLTKDNGTALGKMAKFAMESAVSPSGTPEEAQFWKGLTAILSFSKTNVEAETYPISRHYQKAVAIRARDEDQKGGGAMSEREARNLITNVVGPLNHWIQDKDPAHNPQRYMTSLVRMEESLKKTLTVTPEEARASIRNAEAVTKVLKEKIPGLVIATLRQELLSMDTASSDMLSAQKKVTPKTKEDIKIS